MLLPQIFPQSEHLRAVRQDAAWYWTYLANWKIAFNGWGDFPALAHFWSLAVEEQFYLVWPVVVLSLSRRSLLYVCLGCVVVSWLVRAGLHWSGYTLAGYVLTPARADTLALGASVALVLRGADGVARLRRWSLLLFTSSLAGVVAILLWRGSDYEDFVVQTYGLSLLAFLFAAAVGLALTCRQDSVPRRILANPMFVLFGHYSYAMYVFHHILLLFKPEAVSSAALTGVLGSDLLGRLVFAILGIWLTLGIAMVSWHVYEKQFLKLKRYFPYNDSRGPCAAPPREAAATRHEVGTPNAALNRST